MNILLVFITQSYFSVTKDVKLNSTHYLTMKINNKKESQDIDINNSADIDYKHFMKIYRECRKKTYSFLTIDTTLTATDLLRFKKNCFNLIKMTVADQIKILDRKIKQNKAQYNLDRKIAKISPFSSNDLEKYEYLIGEDLDLEHC